jgi:hypothetical protein
MPLFADPHLRFRLGSPYDWLETRLKEVGKPGIGPSSSTCEINEAFFDLMAAGRSSQEDREAWDQLRHVDRRSALDFSMYELSTEDDYLVDSALWELAPPLQLPDFLALVDEPPDFNKISQLPEAPDPGPIPQPVTLSFETFPLEAADIGPIFYDEKSLWGDENANG